jgi:hypothetical protein
VRVVRGVGYGPPGSDRTLPVPEVHNVLGIDQGADPRSTQFDRTPRRPSDPLEDANQFFSELLSKVDAVTEAARPHLASVQAAVAVVKRLLGSGDTIRLHDSVMLEAGRVRDAISASSFPTEIEFDGEELAVLTLEERYAPSTRGGVHHYPRAGPSD